MKIRLARIVETETGIASEFARGDGWTRDVSLADVMEVGGEFSAQRERDAHAWLDADGRRRAPFVLLDETEDACVLLSRLSRPARRRATRRVTPQQAYAALERRGLA